MKPHIWILAGSGLGLTAYFIFNRRSPECAPAADGLEATATRAILWGRKKRVSGAGRYAAGKLKEGIGKVIGDDALVGEGIVDQVAGAVKHTAGEVAGAAGEAIHNVNR